MEAKVTLEQKDIFRFLLYYLYVKPVGALYLLVGLGAVGAGVYFITAGNNMGIYLIVFAAIYLALQPYVLFTKSKKVSSNPFFKEPTVYRFSEEKIEIRLPDGDETELLWENVYRFVRSREEYYMFLDRQRANIIPVRTLGPSSEELEKMVRKMMDPKKVRGLKK